MWIYFISSANFTLVTLDSSILEGGKWMFIIPVVVCELLFTKSCLMRFVAHSKIDFFVLFYFIHCATLESTVGTNCCLKKNLVIKTLEILCFPFINTINFFYFCSCEFLTDWRQKVPICIAPYLDHCCLLWSQECDELFQLN